MSGTIWKYTAGKRGHTVVAEEYAGRMIALRWWDPSLRQGAGNWRRQSIRSRSRALAERLADDKSLALKRGERARETDRTTLAAIMAEYLKHRTPAKSLRVQQADERMAELMLHHFGADMPAGGITVRQWQEFVSRRLQGRIDGRGRAVREADRTKRRPRVVQAELRFLRAVYNWASAWDSEGGFLLPANPLASRRFVVPDDKNPRQVEMTHDRYLLLLKASSGTIEVRWGGPRRPHPSYLPQVLTILNGTGRRFSAVLRLCASDYIPTRTRECPYGAIVWPEDSDKSGRRWECPIGADVRSAIGIRLKDRHPVGKAPLFPAPADPSRPVCRQTVDGWIRDAEVRGRLAPQDGTLVHALRRKFATEHMHLPAQLVMHLMGIRRMETYQRYVQRHPLGLYSALADRRELREIRA